jgi:membrane glycosyltransferase
MLVAPILMLFHSHFVLATFRGRRVEWSAQERGEQGQRFSAAVAAHWKQTLAGVLVGVVVWQMAPMMFFWLLPVLVGLVLAIPLSMLLSSVGVGRALGRRGLLATPEETAVPMVLQRYRHFLALPPPKDMTDSQRMFRRILADPAFLALHCCILQTTGAVTRAVPLQVQMAERQLLAGGPLRVSAENRKAILSDPAALTALHLFAWTSSRSRHPQTAV